MCHYQEWHLMSRKKKSVRNQSATRIANVIVQINMQYSYPWLCSLNGWQYDSEFLGSHHRGPDDLWESLHQASSHERTLDSPRDDGLVLYDPSKGATWGDIGMPHKKKRNNTGGVGIDFLIPEHLILDAMHSRAGRCFRLSHLYSFSQEEDVDEDIRPTCTSSAGPDRPDSWAGWLGEETKPVAVSLADNSSFPKLSGNPTLTDFHIIDSDKLRNSANSPC